MTEITQGQIAEVDREKWHDLEFNIGVCRRYHQKRSAYFERCDTTITIFSIVFGSSAFVSSVSGLGGVIPTVSTLMVVLLTTVSAIKGFAKRACGHAEIGRQYTALQHDVAGMRSDERTPENFKLTQGRLRDIEIQEPPEYLYILHAICFNEELVSRGLDEAYLKPVTAIQAFFSVNFDFKPYRLWFKGECDRR